MSTYRYWQHFLALESDFSATSRYVDISEQNFATFSVEYAKLLLAICSEIDVLCKVVCLSIDSAARRMNMNDYRKCLNGHTQLASEEVVIRRYGLSFKPWQSWSDDKNPTWWESHRQVLLERDRNFNKANLENCVNAISGLFSLVLYCHQAEKSGALLEPLPVLLGREREPSLLIADRGYEGIDFTSPQFLGNSPAIFP